MESALAQSLTAGEVPSYERIRAQVMPAGLPPCPALAIPVPDLQGYDALIGAEAAA